MKRLKRLFCTAAAAGICLLSGCVRIEDIPTQDTAQTGLSAGTSISPDTKNTASESVSVTSASSSAASSASSEEIVIGETTAEQTTVGAAFTEVISAEETVTQTAITEETTAEAAITEETAAETTITEETFTEQAQLPESVQTASETSAVQTYYPQTDYYALNFDTQKAVWISYLEYDRIMKGSSEEEFAALIGECFDNIAAIGCNTVYFQVRAYGDAYYDSSLFPAGDRLTGGYDPLKTAVKAAHDRGLSIHAWVNPMRLMTDEQMRSVSEEYPIGRWYNDPAARSLHMSEHSGRWYLNPASSEAVGLICDGISEIVSAYRVDGIQIDDYFYPTEDSSFDSELYLQSGSELSLGDWRRENMSAMVRAIYGAVHAANPTAVFGISPQGNAEADFNTLFADVYRWTSEEGYCDYICPQIYYGFDNSTLPYTSTVKLWRDMIKRSDISLVIGLAAYKSGREDTFAGDGRYEWTQNDDILARQKSTAEDMGAGYAYFRYDSLFSPDSSVRESVNAELERLYN